ncbi:hypothetical protein [Nocardia jinanensis]|uniref:Uncharacterized protein n=1 Tax=Nocardia jinanensis TaxID=382504 RepID=A0A917VX47_9NOCA|nr:hypothetical protein [Nocardia jinanensis]GGL38339.1 hypothetical protein GCM10011588_61170 [Nocardia jinanensis]
MADSRDPALMYLVEISRPALGDESPWWATRNTGTADQVVAALRELADRVARDLPSMRSWRPRCWYRYLVRWRDGSILDSCDGIAAPETAVREQRLTAAIVFTVTRPH